MALSAIILAAGKATRMKSERVKVLHEICGRPMLSYVIDACREAGVERLYLVIGHDRERVIHEYSREKDITWVVQEQQMGTGHAVLVCKEKIAEHGGLTGEDHVYVLGGDGPLIRGATLKALAEKHLATGAAVTLATSILENPTGYGRIVRDGANGVAAIVEQNDATEEQKKIREVNPTYWMFRTQDLFESLGKVKPNNKKGEYYLTDTLAILKEMGRRLEAVASVPAEDVLSINTRSELADVTRVMERRIQRGHMEGGVTLVSPESTFIEYGAVIGQDTVIEPFSTIRATARIAKNSRVMSGSVVV